MKIIDKTNDTWKIGDTVIDNDGRLGMIKKDKDDDFVIIRIDDAHVGTYCNGLAYEFGCSMQRLQNNASKFHKVNNNNDDEDWQPGDFVKDDKGNVGLIMQNEDFDWQIVFIKSCSSGATFKTWSTANRAKYLLKDLKEANPEFHKVPSKVILGK